MRPYLAKHRCPGCEIRKELCFCEFIPRLELRTCVTIVMHTAEEVLTTNTARLVNKTLVNSRICIRGRKDLRLAKADLLTEPTQPLLLFPSPWAVELHPDLATPEKGPVTLIVPDGGWPHARRMVRRDPALAGIPHVKLPAGPPSEYRLRAQPSQQSLCTLEAIARAVGILESPAAQRKLEELLRIMVERTLWSRGLISAEECVAAGIPQGAFV